MLLGLDHGLSPTNPPHSTHSQLRLLHLSTGWLDRLRLHHQPFALQLLHRVAVPVRPPSVRRTCNPRITQIHLPRPRNLQAISVKVHLFSGLPPALERRLSRLHLGVLRRQDLSPALGQRRRHRPSEAPPCLLRPRSVVLHPPSDLTPHSQRLNHKSGRLLLRPRSLLLSRQASHPLQQLLQRPLRPPLRRAPSPISCARIAMVHRH